MTFLKEPGREGNTLPCSSSTSVNEVFLRTVCKSWLPETLGFPSFFKKWKESDRQRQAPIAGVETHILSFAYTVFAVVLTTDEAALYFWRAAVLIRGTEAHLT